MGLLIETYNLKQNSENFESNQNNGHDTYQDYYDYELDMQSDADQENFLSLHIP